MAGLVILSIVIVAALLYWLRAKAKKALLRDADAIRGAATYMAEQRGLTKIAQILRDDPDDTWTKEAYRMLVAEDARIMLGDLSALPHKEKILAGGAYLLRMAIEGERMHQQLVQRLGYDPLQKR